MTDATQKDLPRLVLSALIMVYFGYAVIEHWTAGLEQTVTNLAMLVAGYWVGSSKGSTDKAAQIDRMQGEATP